MKYRLPSFALGGLATIVATGCAQLSPVMDAVAIAPSKLASNTTEFFEGLFNAPKAAVEAIELGRAQNCNSQGRESVINLFTDVQQLVAWEALRGVQLTEVTASLPPGSYVIAEMGARNTGGYALVVSRQAAQDGESLFIKASYLSPKTSAMASQMLTAPCSLVAVRSSTAFKTVALLDQSNKLRAEWSVATAGPALVAPAALPSAAPEARASEPLPAEPAAPIVPSDTGSYTLDEILKLLPPPEASTAPEPPVEVPAGPAPEPQPSPEPTP